MILIEQSLCLFCGAGEVYVRGGWKRFHSGVDTTSAHAGVGKLVSLQQPGCVN